MKILIVDDEAPARDRLRRLLEESDEHEIVGEAGDGHEALKMAAALEPDIVLLDIRMPGLNGLATAHHLSTLEQAPAVVFTTAYDEYAVNAFDAQAIGYILKPVRRERLSRALERAKKINAATIDSVADQSGIDGQRRHICARVHGELRLIPVEDVHYFQADQKYTRVCFDGGEHLIDDSIKKLEEEFADDFVRIHRSALVAVSRILALEKTGDGQVFVRLRDGDDKEGDQLAISRRHVAEVRRRLKGRPD